MELLVIIIVIVILVFAFSNPLNTAKNKGIKGESRVARKLRKLQKEEYKVFNDVMINTSRGSSQIDHIVISIYGIFVIETKNYSGWIHGNENSQYWTQSIYKKKTKIWNPVKQNWAHIYALKEVLSNRVIYHPIVVFTGKAELKNVYSKIPVVYLSQLYKTIIANREMPSLTKEQVIKLADNLTLSLVSSRGAKSEHVRHVKRQAKLRKSAVKSLECPRCGNALVVRKGPYGKFYGCSNFPRCKHKLKY